MFSPALLCIYVYKLCQSYLGHRDEVIKFWKVKVGGGGMRSTERPSSLANEFCSFLDGKPVSH